jgi:hypothetical protein
MTPFDYEGEERHDEPIPADVRVHPARVSIDVPEGSSFGEVVAAALASGLDLGWSPIGSGEDKDVVTHIVTGGATDVTRGGRRLRDRILGFWFEGPACVGYFGSGVRKDVSGYGLRRAIASGSWKTCRVLAVRLAVVPASTTLFAATDTAAIAELDDALLATVRRASRLIGSGVMVLDDNRLRFVARDVSPAGLTYALAAAIPGTFRTVAPIDADRYRALLAARDTPRAWDASAHDALAAAEAGATSWYAAGSDLWVDA